MAFFDRFLQPGRTARKPVAPAPQMSVNKPVFGPKAPTMNVRPAPMPSLSSTPKGIGGIPVRPATMPNFNSSVGIGGRPVQAAKMPNTGGLLGKVAPQAFGGNSNLSTTSYGNNVLKQPSNFFSKPQVVGPSGQPMSSVPQMSVAPPLTLEQMQAKNDALRRSQGRTQGQVQASSGAVVPPPAPKPTPPPPQVSGSGFKASLDPLDPAAIGGAQMRPQIPKDQSLVRPDLTMNLGGGFDKGFTADMPTQTAPQAPSQIEALRKAYLDSLDPSSDEAGLMESLGGISGSAAAETAKAKQEYAARIAAIQDQATLQPFLTGRQLQASGQLTNQLEALSASTEAQTMPLQQRLAALQAQRQAEQKRRETELGFAQKDVEREDARRQAEAEGMKPIEVGGRLINPRTGEVIYEAPAEAEKPMTLAPGQTVWDRATGRVLFTAPERPSETGGGVPTIKEINGTSYQWDEASGQWVNPSGATGGGTDSAAVETLQNKVALIDSLMTSPGMAGSVGPYGFARWTPFNIDASERQDFAAGVQQLIAKDTMDVLLNLKKQGGTLGALSDQERILLQSAASKIGTWMQRDKNGNPTGKFEVSEDAFKKELQTLRDLTSSALQRAGGGGAGAAGPGDELDQVLDSLGFNPVGGVTNTAQLKELTIGNRTVRVAPSIALRLAKAAKDFRQATGRDVQINQDFRSHEEQARLYKELSAKGARVAPPGQSFHEKGMAIDVTNWREFEPFARRYGLVNDLPDDRGHFSYLETNRRA